MDDSRDGNIENQDEVLRMLGEGCPNSGPFFWEEKDRKARGAEELTPETSLDQSDEANVQVMLDDGCPNHGPFHWDKDHE